MCLEEWYYIFPQIWKLFFNKYSQYDVSLSALTEVESEKVFSVIYSFSSHNSIVAVNPETFVRGFGRAAVESFFNSSVELRSNKVYKATSRRVPLVVAKFSPQQLQIPQVLPSAKEALASLVRQLISIYEKSNRVRSTSKHYIDHKPPTLAIYAAKLDLASGLDDEEYNGETAAVAEPIGVSAESAFVPAQCIYQVGDVTGVLPIHKSQGVFWLARVCLALLQGEEQVKLECYHVGKTTRVWK